MNDASGSNHWQRRWQPLLQQWVIVAATTAARPWSGATEKATQNTLPQHDPDCYLCPGVTRSAGTTNPDYKGAFAFDNDYPTLAAHAPSDENTENILQSFAPAIGRCRVLCWSENHNDTLASLSEEKIVAAVQLWKDEYISLSALDDVKQVLIFENKGVEIGVSNLHPHGQIYATGFVTDTAERMRNAQVTYANAHNGDNLLQAMLASEHVQKSLLVEKNTYWSVIVPYAARFSYETWIIPHRAIKSIADASDAEMHELALCYQRQVRRYDKLFQRSAPNITLLHNAPCDDHKDNQQWCFHLAFHPPLRDKEKLKFLAGFESGSNNIVNPLKPEDAAMVLRELAEAEK